MIHTPKRVLVPALLVLAGGCSNMAIDGLVLDARGNPINGAVVATIGSPCLTTTEETGKFALTCPPGKYTVVVSAEGYTSNEVELDASETKRYDIGKQVLIKIPEEKGLFLFGADAYEPMQQGFVVRELTKDGSLTHRKFCLDADKSKPNEVKAGVAAFFDYEHPGWRPFRLDDEGCAYRDTKNQNHQWKVVYREKAEYETRQINEGKTIARMKLEPGQYFVADWKGFFVPVEEHDTEHIYTGYWLKVE